MYVCEHCCAQDAIHSNVQFTVIGHDQQAVSVIDSRPRGTGGELSEGKFNVALVISCLVVVVCVTKSTTDGHYCGKGPS